MVLTRKTAVHFTSAKFQINATFRMLRPGTWVERTSNVHAAVCLRRLQHLPPQRLPPPQVLHHHHAHARRIFVRQTPAEILLASEHSTRMKQCQLRTDAAPLLASKRRLKRVPRNVLSTSSVRIVQHQHVERVRFLRSALLSEESAAQLGSVFHAHHAVKKLNVQLSNTTVILSVNVPRPNAWSIVELITSAVALLNTNV